MASPSLKIRPTEPSLTDTLCTSCGLCCDGSLFADVELAGGDEAAALEILGLEVEEADGERRDLLVQPCRALRGTRCKVYPHRPDCCGTFECRLLQRARRGEVGVAQALARITDARRRVARVRALLAGLGPSDARLPLGERCAEGLARSEARDGRAAARKQREGLKAALRATERFLRETFLDG